MSLPQVPDSFYWTHEAWGAALRCRPLESVAQHLFTTRQLELPSREAWQKLASSAGVSSDRLVTLSQVHGRHVVTIRRGIEPGALQALQNSRPDADGVVSDAPDVALVVRAADCVPLLMADKRIGVVAAVHAGWRSTAKRIAARALLAMAAAYGTKPGDCRVAIGPGIRGCCYEVDAAVTDAMLAALPAWEEHAVASRPGHVRLDLGGVNRALLERAGVRPDRIGDVGLCTACRRDLFFSHRAEKARTGRMMNLILLRDERRET